MKRLISLGAGLAAFAAFLIPATAGAAQLASPVQLTLDTRTPAKQIVAGPVSTSDFLANGSFYVITVSGNWSPYIPGLWNGQFPHIVVCGTTDTIQNPSPTAPTTPGSQDAEWIYALPLYSPCDSNHKPGGTFQMPRRNDGFRVDLTGTGTAFTHLVQDPSATAPVANHTYTYLVKGLGAIASFENLDTQTKDNNGIFTINIRPATAADCGTNQDCLGAPPVTSVPSITPPPNVPVHAPSKSRTCISRRLFKIRVPSRRADPVVAAVVTVNGKRLVGRRVKLSGTRRVVATIDFRGLKTKRTIVMRIIARTRSGHLERSSRTYHTCVARRRIVLHAKPRRDRTTPFTYRVSGRVDRPSTAPRNACSGGKVRVVSRAGHTVLSRRTLTLTSSCTFRFTETLRHVPQRLLGRELRVTGTFLGTKALRGSTSRPVTLTAG